MATVSTQQLTATGAALNYASASAGGDRFTPGPRSVLHVVNGSGASVTATVATPAQVEGLTLPGRPVVVPAGASRMLPVSSDIYRAADGLGDISWSASASVTFAIVQV